jgi:N-acetylglucosamine-6-phosphate deacetylase
MQANHTNSQVILASKLVMPEKIISDAALVVKDSKIQAVGEKETIQIPESANILEYSDKIIAPGLIDIHIHGFDGVEAGHSVEDTIQIAQSIARNGTTAFLPTVSFAPTLEGMLEMLDITAQAIETEQDGAQMLGINFEAPFITRKGKGPWDRYPPAGLSAGKMARDPSVKELRQMAQAARGHIKTMIIAPELEGALDVIREMRKLGIIPSVGHTAASYEEVVKGIEAGLLLATHIYNAMRRQDHREPGVIEAALMRDELTAEIVGDCVHVLPPAVEIAIRCKGVDNIILVTDNTKFAGMPNGEYKDDLGRDVVKDDEKVHIPGWTLVGSVSPLNRNVSNTITRVGRSLPEAFKMAALNPARLLGLENQKGSLEPGKDADLIVVDDQINVHATMIRGKWLPDLT